MIAKIGTFKSRILIAFRASLIFIKAQCAGLGKLQFCHCANFANHPDEFMMRT